MDTPAPAVTDMVAHLCPADGSAHEASPFCACEPKLQMGESTTVTETDDGEEIASVVEQLIQYVHRGIDGTYASGWTDDEDEL